MARGPRGARRGSGSTSWPENLLPCRRGCLFSVPSTRRSGECRRPRFEFDCQAGNATGDPTVDPGTQSRGCASVLHHAFGADRRFGLHWDFASLIEQRSLPQRFWTRSDVSKVRDSGPKGTSVFAHAIGFARYDERPGGEGSLGVSPARLAIGPAEGLVIAVHEPMSGMGWSLSHCAAWSQSTIPSDSACLPVGMSEPAKP